MWKDKLRCCGFCFAHKCRFTSVAFMFWWQGLSIFYDFTANRKLLFLETCILVRLVFPFSKSIQFPKLLLYPILCDVAFFKSSQREAFVFVHWVSVSLCARVNCSLELDLCLLSDSFCGQQRSVYSGKGTVVWKEVCSWESEVKGQS